MWPSRAELTKLMGMDDSQWESASYLEDLLEMLHQQREENVNSKRGAYVFAARSMYRWTFRVTNGPSYDSKRKCLWYLGQKGPEEPEDNKLDVRRTYHITQKGRYLSVYVDPKGLPSKRIMRFDMLHPGHRQAFLNVRHLAVERCPPVQHAAPAEHRDLLRVQTSPRHLPRYRSTQQSIVVGAAGKPWSRRHSAMRRGEHG
ncbi:hypothetical protein BDZ45DRAFT_674961 [Acephala macrosclerotiorum]|nr:hypothetical protein BDZ45DRAFT_674961 [Acephala macrosclerotiorum]